MTFQDLSLTEGSLCHHIGLFKWIPLLLLPNCRNFTVEKPFPSLYSNLSSPLPGLRALSHSSWAVWVPSEVTHLYPLALAPADLGAGREKRLGRRLVRAQQLWGEAAPSPPGYSVPGAQLEASAFPSPIPISCVI